MTSMTFQMPHLGMFYAVAASLLFSLSSAAVKCLMNVPSLQLSLARLTGVAVSSFIPVIYLKQDIFPKQDRIKIMLRGLMGSTSMILELYAYQHMPLGNASAIICSIPVVVSIFSRIFLKENCSLMTVFSIIISICGIILVIKPSFLFPTANLEGSGIDGPLAAIASLILMSLTIIVAKKLSHLHCCILLFNFSLVALIFVSLLTAFTGNFIIVECGWDQLLLYGMTLFSFLSQLIILKSLQIEDASLVSVAFTTTFIFSYALEIMIFGKSPDLISIAGSVLIFASIIVLTVQKILIKLPENSNRKKNIFFLIKDITSVNKSTL